MQPLFRDVRYALRSLLKSPGLTLVATIALMFGIGLTTTMFSIVYGAMMKGLPYPEGKRIMLLYRNNPSQGQQRLSFPIAEYVDYRDAQHSLDDLGAYYSGTVNVSGEVDAERFAGSFVTSNVLRLTRVRPVLGRTIQAGDDVPGGPHVVVIGNGIWQRRFGGDPNIIGRSIRANGQPYTIVGVMPAAFRFPENTDIWLPLQLDPLAQKRNEGQWVDAVARLKPAVTEASATADVNAIAQRLGTEYKDVDGGVGAYVQEFTEANIGPQPRQLLYTMLGAVFFVLLIACANVANLLLDRAAHKTREVGIRTALGASRSAVVRQFLSEALILSIAGTVLGTMLAQAGIMIFNRSIVDADPPFYIDISLHPPVLAFVALLSVLATLFSGVIPAIQSSRADINEVLKDESRGSSSLHIGRMSRSLVIFEIALSCGLLVASGLTIKSVTKLKDMDPGFRTHNMFTARIGFPALYTDTLAQARLYDQLRTQLVSLPGVTGAVILSNLPGVGANGGSFEVEGKSYAANRDLPNARWLAVSPGFFESFKVTPLAGRGLNESDRSDAAPVIVVNRAFADKYFAGKDALGQRIRQGGLESKQPWMTVVGVVPNTFTGDPDLPRAPMYFAPLAQHHSNFVSIAVAVDGPPMGITSSVRHAVSSLNADIPLYWVYSMDQAMARPTWYIRIFGTMFMIFGLIALFLASIGLYAVMSFSVSRRIREVGIRMALGARAGNVIALVFRQGTFQLGLGMVLGLALAAGLAQLMKVILFDVQPRDPTIFGGVAAVLAAAGLLACFVPARRATRVDPLVALRQE